MRTLPLLVLLSCTFFHSWAFQANAQDAVVNSDSEQDTSTYTLILRNVALEEALEQLVSTTKINLLYDPDLIADASVSCASRDASAEDILRCITLKAELDFYRLSSGTYVLIEKPEDPPQLGDLAGIVVDKSTGEPLPYANVILADASTGTSTNGAGMFTFTSLLTGPHKVVTTYLGYRASYDSVWVPPDGHIRQRIELEPEPIVADPIIVNGLQQRLPSSELGFNARETSQLNTPGGIGAGDPIYGTSSIMSIGVRPPFVDLHIQGGESGEHLTLLDGVPVFEPISLGRLMGAFSPLAIGRITVHKAGFGADVGSQLSGVMRVEQDLGSDRLQGVTAQIDPLSINGRVNISVDLPGAASSSFIVAARTSFWDVYQYGTLNTLLQSWNTVDPVLSETAIGSLNSNEALFTPHRHGSDISFSDVHAASTIQLNPFSKLYLGFYQGENEIGSELLTSDAANVTDDVFILLTRDQYKWTNTTTQARFESLLGARALGMIRIRNSLHTLRHNYQYQDNQSAVLDPNFSVAEIESALTTLLDEDTRPENRNRIRETALEATVDFSISKDQHLLAGLEIIETSNRFRLNSPFFIPLSLNYSGWRHAGFIQHTTQLGLQTVLEIGSRFTYIPDRNTLYSEPRVSLRYDLPETTTGAYSFLLAAGIYRQFTNPFDLSNAGPSAAVPSIRLWMPIDETLAPPRAYHLTASALWMPYPDLTVRLETFYKDQPRILSIDYPTILTNQDIAEQDVDESDIIDATKGFALGGGLYVEKTYRKGISSAQYSFSISERSYPGRFDGARQSTPWNEPHRVTLSQDLFITNALTARIRANGIWGRSWGFRQAYYDYLSAHNGATAYEPFVLDRPSEDTLPPVYQLDIGLSYEHTFSGFRAQIRGDILNALDRDNVVDWGLESGSEPGSFQKVNRIMPGITTAISLRVQF